MHNGTENAPKPVAMALEHMTGLARGSVTWLTGPALDVTLDPGCLIHIDQTGPGPASADLVARLHEENGYYRIEAAANRKVWVNGTLVSDVRLSHGDTVEFGETGPICRLRVYTDHSKAQNSVADILSDIAIYLRVSRQQPVRRVLNASGALVGRLASETSLLFRVSVLSAIVLLGFLAYQQRQMNRLLMRSIDSATAQLDSVAAALVAAQNEALRPADLTDLRAGLEQRVQANVSRLEELEQRSTASARVIAQSIASVVFLQGVYGFQERDGDRMLRQVLDPEGLPLMTFGGRPLLSLDGTGPVVELQFTGTGFLVGADRILITNRHVARPWERSTGMDGLGMEGLRPLMIRMIGYLPGQSSPLTVSERAASDTADLAILTIAQGSVKARGLDLADDRPKAGDEVIVIGYPTGLRSMLAQSGPAFIEELQKTENTGFFSVAERLAEGGFIAPLSSRGIVAQVTASTIVYDADTTHGGSGGPVLDLTGQVLAVNAAILPEYGGSNFGLPAAAVRQMLRDLAGE